MARAAAPVGSRTACRYAGDCLGETCMDIKIYEDRIEAKLTGEIDIVNSDEFKKEIISLYDEVRKDIVFDCTALTFLDSTALGVLVAINNHMIREGHSISLHSLKGRIFKLFTITGLDRVIKVTEAAL